MMMMICKLYKQTDIFARKFNMFKWPFFQPILFLLLIFLTQLTCGATTVMW